MKRICAKIIIYLYELINSLYRLLRKHLHILIALSFCLFTKNAYSQKVGLVLSGGGSSGLSHIGVIKALEDNNIPIDYICGASSGGLIGAFYAIGYSPREIEKIVNSKIFQSITKGDIPRKYEYMIKKRNDYASWFSYKYDFNTNYIENIPTNLINSIPIDYYLMETFSGRCNKSNDNFDSLFVPFRCLASDIENKKTIVFKNGSLPSALRAGISYPFYLRPLNIDNKLLFDGGLYNSFPIDVMQEEFHPDFIIGSNVSEKKQKPDEDNLYLQIRSLLTNQTDSNSFIKNGIIIEPWTEATTFNFDDSQKFIDSGYAATVRIIPELKKQIKNNKINLDQNRILFRKQYESIIFDDIKINGFTKNQGLFIKNSLFKNKKTFSLIELEKKYFRLVSDDKIKNIFPAAKLDSLKKLYTLQISGKKEKPFCIEPGAIISNRPISEAFIGLQFNYLGRVGFSAYTNCYIGKLNTGTHSNIRIDIPGVFPFFIESSYTYSHLNYYSSSALFYDILKPAFLIQDDQFAEFKIGIPVGNISQFNLSSGYTQWKNEYYQTDIFTRLDTADISYFDYSYLQTNYNINTLNRKMYATEGILLNLRARYLIGQESYIAGNTSNSNLDFKNKKQDPWLQLKISFENYIKTIKRFKIGVYGEGVYSTQQFFVNYKSSILSAPAFNPTPESQTFFIDAFRSHNYLAGGLKLIISPTKFVDVRFEGYIFQPYQSIKENSDKKAEYSSPFLYRYYSGLAAAVINSPIGPISIGINYYDQYENPFSFFFHIGYIIFNRKSID